MHEVTNAKPNLLMRFECQAFKKNLQCTVVWSEGGEISRVEFGGCLQNLLKLLRQQRRGLRGGGPLNELAATRACGCGINHTTRATLHMVM